MILFGTRQLLLVVLCLVQISTSSESNGEQHSHDEAEERADTTTTVAAVGEPGEWPRWAFPKWAKRDPSEDASVVDEITPTSPMKVTFQKKLPHSCSETPLPFATGTGQTFKCCLDNDESLPDHSDAIAALATPTASPQLARELDDALVKLVPSGHAILWATAGWWTYELCPNRYIRQYHHEANIIQSEYYLGVGRDVLTGPACGVGVRYKDESETAHKKVKRLYAKQSIAADGTWRIVADSTTKDAKLKSRPYFATSYHNGEVCDVTGKPREVELQMHCKQEGAVVDDTATVEQSFTVQEVSPCKYSAVLLSEHVCQLPEYTNIVAYLNQDSELSPNQRSALAREHRQNVLTSTNVKGVDGAVYSELGSKGCIMLKTGGWWTYELCFRHWLRQYHEVEDVIDTEYFIGRGVSANSQTDSLAVRDQAYNIGGKKVMKKMHQVANLKRVKANGTWTAHGDLVWHCYRIYTFNLSHL